MPGLGLLLALQLATQAKAEVLVRQLADPRFVVRDTATAQLRKLDLAALPALRKAVKDPDPEIARRGRMLTDQIESRHAMLDGVEFRVSTDPAWGVPPGEIASYPVVGLRVTNRSDRTQRVRFDCSWVTLQRPDGERVPDQTGWFPWTREAPRASPPLAPGQAHTFPSLSTALYRLKEEGQADQFRFLCRPFRGCTEVFEDLAPGTYQVRLTCEHNGREVTTPPVTVEIK